MRLRVAVGSGMAAPLTLRERRPVPSGMTSASGSASQAYSPETVCSPGESFTTGLPPAPAWPGTTTAGRPSAWTFWGQCLVSPGSGSQASR